MWHFEWLKLPTPRMDQSVYVAMYGTVDGFPARALELLQPYVKAVRIAEVLVVAAEAAVTILRLHLNEGAILLESRARGNRFYISPGWAMYLLREEIGSDEAGGKIEHTSSRHMGGATMHWMWKRPIENLGCPVRRRRAPAGKAHHGAGQPGALCRHRGYDDVPGRSSSQRFTSV